MKQSQATALLRLPSFMVCFACAAEFASVPKELRGLLPPHIPIQTNPRADCKTSARAFRPATAQGFALSSSFVNRVRSDDQRHDHFAFQIEG